MVTNLDSQVGPCGCRVTLEGVDLFLAMNILYYLPPNIRVATYCLLHPVQYSYVPGTRVAVWSHVVPGSTLFRIFRDWGDFEKMLGEIGMRVEGGGRRELSTMSMINQLWSEVGGQRCLQ